jgi:cell division protein FtsB
VPDVGHRAGCARVKKPILIPVVIAVSVSFMLTFFLGHSGLLRLRRLQDEYDRVLLQNQQMAIENRRYAEEIKRLRDDPAAVEKIAREELHYVSPHDRVLIVPEEKGDEDPGAAESPDGLDGLAVP